MLKKRMAFLLLCQLCLVSNHEADVAYKGKALDLMNLAVPQSDTHEIETFRAESSGSRSALPRQLTSQEIRQQISLSGYENFLERVFYSLRRYMPSLREPAFSDITFYDSDSGHSPFVKRNKESGVLEMSIELFPFKDLNQSSAPLREALMKWVMSEVMRAEVVYQLDAAYARKSQKIHGFTKEVEALMEQIDFFFNITSEPERRGMYDLFKQIYAQTYSNTRFALFERYDDEKWLAANNRYGHKPSRRALEDVAEGDSIYEAFKTELGSLTLDDSADAGQSVTIPPFVVEIADHFRKNALSFYATGEVKLDKKACRSLKETFNNKEFFGAYYGIWKQRAYLKAIKEASQEALEGLYYDKLVIVVDEQNLEASEREVRRMRKEGWIPQAMPLIKFDPLGNTPTAEQGKENGEALRLLSAKHQVILLPQPAQNGDSNQKVLGNWSAVFNLIHKIGAKQLAKSNTLVMLDAGSGERNAPLTLKKRSKGRITGVNSEICWVQALKQALQSFQSDAAGVNVISNDQIKSLARDDKYPADGAYRAKFGFSVKGSLLPKTDGKGNVNPALMDLGLFRLNPDGTVGACVEKPKGEDDPEFKKMFSSEDNIPTNWADYFLRPDVIEIMGRLIKGLTVAQAMESLRTRRTDAAIELGRVTDYDVTQLGSEAARFKDIAIKKLRARIESIKNLEDAFTHTNLQDDSKLMLDADGRPLYYKYGLDSANHFLAAATAENPDVFFNKIKEGLKSVEGQPITKEDSNKIYSTSRLIASFGIGYLDAGANAIFGDTGKNADFLEFPLKHLIPEDESAVKAPADPYAKQVYRDLLGVQIVTNDVSDAAGNLLVKAGAIVGPNVVFGKLGRPDKHEASTLFIRDGIWQFRDPKFVAASKSNQEPFPPVPILVARGAIVAGLTQLDPTSGPVHIAGNSVVIDSFLSNLSVPENVLVYGFNSKNSRGSGMFPNRLYFTAQVAPAGRITNVPIILDINISAKEIRDDKLFSLPDGSRVSLSDVRKNIVVDEEKQDKMRQKLEAFIVKHHQTYPNDMRAGDDGSLRFLTAA